MLCIRQWLRERRAETPLPESYDVHHLFDNMTAQHLRAVERQEKRRHLIEEGTFLRSGGTISLSPATCSFNFFQQNLLHILYWICITRSYFLSCYRLILMIPAQNILN